MIHKLCSALHWNIFVFWRLHTQDLPETPKWEEMPFLKVVANK